ncbi:MAG: hypothetical protein HY940_08495 [Gammaproteobacteria bacterium]|nr:hypothetical protein [Gammaproteobacteria bacterium]
MVLSGPAALALDSSNLLQLHGFASQSFITTSDNNFFGETSSNDNFGFTELGLNGSTTTTSSRLRLAGQLLLRRAGESDNGRARLDYGLIDYTMLTTDNQRLGVRAGRILNPLGFYNETRDMAFTRPSILLPQSIYFDRTRDLAISSDGFQLYGERRWNSDELQWQLGAAAPRVDNKEIEVALLRTDLPGGLEANTSFLGRVLWEHNGGEVRLALSTIQANISYAPGAIDPVPAGDITFEPTIVSAQYNSESWSLTSEYALRHFKYANFSPAINTSLTGDSYYLQGSYRLSSRHDIFARYDTTVVDRSDRNGEQYATLNPSTPAHRRYAKDLTLGTGYTITPSLLLRGEWHHVDGTAWLPALDNLQPTTRGWDMLSVLISYRF